MKENATPVSKGKLWGGRVMSGLPALFLLFDGVMKLVKPALVVQATLQLGYPESVIIGLGITLLACTDSAHRRRRRDLTDRLSRWRHRDPGPCRQSAVHSHLVPGLSRCADLGRPAPARRAAAHTHSVTKPPDRQS